ncbi:MAG: hypoxanthine phosphoribosyltransferase [Candidatus Scalindua sp.]|jgi:hypoxanthine phosphoribosyltransferase|nr:hypoxanthine phosphoribosyltransferase [Candidatus Scalindua sp.]MBT5305317.1 hypoxanthine phosphoribosyltransferase [Candidatus Scalindua sp.]MBT6049998.1 hypoxanthine phosphoribosyltransferase [Candidatus Scalindua sp.]MBT6225924.1 hypoxanthine phosphoribosyltransferase [Candidatus Scalindua sp.]MBT6561313.1 hypoxanthine phosphoribosyltransferase [Candidatus Scalindua sp.]
MKNDIGEILISEIEIKNSVSVLAQKLAVDYKNNNLTIIGVLNGSLVFLSDLIRQIPFPVKIDTIRANTYAGASTFPKAETEIIHNIDIDVKNEHVLIVDDILDTGKTLSKIIQMITKHDPLSIKVCVLLNKTARRESEIVPDYCCFEIEDKFVVGYGLDFDNRYRNLPYVAVLKDDIMITPETL